ncbi:Hypothetical predicted protein [Olea europaea subsp. europaea]|uniref:Uncharacterized protein n=1 Tax=Olea europaea subsp. europaea TaxID=158383 RepID=A0A8S0SRG1_OLEEU|nr:Hypothetical predicted protein [Olea europaea subsp. europaea]
MDDQDPSANNNSDIEYKIPITEDEDEDHRQYFDGRRIHKVPQLVRFNKHNKEDYYTPKMVSFGPYYHGLQELGMAEEFKHKVLKIFVSSSGKGKQFFYCQIFKVIGHIRNCYVGVSRDAYDDGALTEMMLLDACFAVYLMKIALGDKKKLSTSVKILECLITRIREDKRQPLHLLDAFHRLLVEELDNAGKNLVQSVNKVQRQLWRKENPNEFVKYDRQSRSVTDLKAKGIHFKPSSYCLKNIKFKSYPFYGQLQLPVFLYNIHSKLFFTHMIAYEASPESDTGIPITCYVNFLKSLIVKPEDVKELRENKIFFSTLDSDEKVVEVIKEIDTCGLVVDSIFEDVKMGIEEHCSSKAKTFIALLAATSLLFLTFLQTYYTMNLK